MWLVKQRTGNKTLVFLILKANAQYNLLIISVFQIIKNTTWQIFIMCQALLTAILHVLFYEMLIITLWVRYYYYGSSFIDENKRVQRG